MGTGRRGDGVVESAVGTIRPTDRSEPADRCGQVIREPPRDTPTISEVSFTAHGDRVSLGG